VLGFATRFAVLAFRRRFLYREQTRKWRHSFINDKEKNKMQIKKKILTELKKNPNGIKNANGFYKTKKQGP
jgi:hypothetical protein